ncbi:MAG: major capsid protein [Rhodospirillaceae bacterium]
MAMDTIDARIVDPVLSEYARGYIQPRLVGSTLFPVAPVLTDSGRVIEFGKEAFRRYNARRAPGVTVKEVSFGYFGKTFRLVQDTLDAKVPRELAEAATQGPGIDLGLRATRVVMGALSLALEIEQAEIAANPANYESDHRVDLTGDDKWSHAASKPIAQLRDYIETVRRSVGIRPNVAVFSAEAFAALEENPSIVDRFKLSQPILTPDLVAALLRLDRVVIAEAVYADDNDVFVDVWGNNVILAYAPQLGIGVPFGGDVGNTSNQQDGYQYDKRINPAKAATYLAGKSAPLGIEQPSFGYTYVLKDYPLVESRFGSPKMSRSSNACCRRGARCRANEGASCRSWRNWTTRA